MVSVAPLGSTAFFNASLAGLARASHAISHSTARLSSGNRLINAGDDVAALSISTRLRTQVLGIKAAQSNTTQGNSFLQVAYGGLTQIRDILTSMKALATQANSAALTSADRELLQQEFSTLSDEIDRLAENTNFNSIALLDGTVSGANTAHTDTSQATQATGSITFTANPGAGDKVILNGVTFTAALAAATATEFTIGVTSTATATNLKTTLNASTNRAISRATYDSNGASMSILEDAGGLAGNQYTIDKANSTAAFTVSGTTTQLTNFYTLGQGANDGLSAGSVKATGTIGDALVTTQSQVHGSVTLTVTGTVSNGELLRIDNGNGSYVDFTFATVASASTDIQIGDDTAETLQNAVNTITQYTGTSNFGSRQLDVTRNGDQLILTNKTSGNPTDFTGTNLDIAETLTNGTLSASSFSNGTNTGINTTGVTNADFTGSIDGFTATYVGADSVIASVTVGSSTYSAAITDTTPGVATTVRFSSTSGGYFDVQLGATGMSVGASDADTYAARLNAAISPLTFYQSRNVSNFSGTGALAGASAQVQLKNFSNIQIKDITVTAPSTPSGDATVEIDVNGEIFRSASGIGGSLGAYETLTFTSITDGNKTIRVTGGSTANDFSDSDAAATFQATLRDSFGLNSAGTGLNFQVGTSNTDKINVNIGDARTTSLFAGVTPTISTQDDAEDAGDALDAALQRVSEITADVGALQSRFDTAFTNLENTRINVDAARAELADTDIAEESTNMATAMLRANSATAVIAQAIKLQSGLLDVLRVN